jgi:hypothetical protein
MAITSNNQKLAVLAWNNVYLSPTYMTVDGITQADQQQLLWQYPGVLFSEYALPSGLVKMSVVFATPVPTVSMSVPTVGVTLGTPKPTATLEVNRD